MNVVHPLCFNIYRLKMNILRQVTKGGKGKPINSGRSDVQDLGTMIICEPTVETKKATFAMS
jgi:hypothetical protein